MELTLQFPFCLCQFYDTEADSGCVNTQSGLKLPRFQMQVKGTDLSPWVSRANEGFGEAAGNICARIKSTRDFVDGWFGLK